MRQEGGTAFPHSGARFWSSRVHALLAATRTHNRQQGLRAASFFFSFFSLVVVVVILCSLGCRLPSPRSLVPASLCTIASGRHKIFLLFLQPARPWPHKTGTLTHSAPADGNKKKEKANGANDLFAKIHQSFFFVQQIAWCSSGDRGQKKCPWAKCRPISLFWSRRCAGGSWRAKQHRPRGYLDKHETW